MMSMNNQDNSACVTSNNTSAYNNNVFSLSNSNVNPINLGSNSNIIGASNNGNRQDYSIMDASSSCSYSADGSGLGHLSDTHKEMVQKFYNNIKMITNNNSTPATNNHIPTQTNKPNNPVTRTNPTQNNNSNTNYKI